MSRLHGRGAACPPSSIIVSVGAIALGLLWPAAAAAQVSGASSASPADTAAPAESGTVAQAEPAIIITGSRLARSTFDTPSPVTVLGAEELDRLQVTNVGQVAAELPAFRPSNSPTTNGFGSFNVGAQIVNLRGLGVTRNLVLVDGRRFAPTTREGSVDLNFIPSTLVSRIEVVTGGASAAYGSDALAGVVNVILDTKLQGLKAQVDYGISELGDAGNLHAGFGYGTGFAGGAGHIIIGGEYSNQEGTGNCLSRDWCKTAGVVTNAGYNTPAGVGNGLPNFVRSNTNAGYFISPAGVINGINNTTAATAGIRNLFGVGGITFAPDGTPLPAQQGSLGFGNFQLGGAIIPGYVEVDLVAPVKRYSLFGHADYDFGDNLHGFVEGSYGHVDGGTFQSSYFSASVPIYADNPYIPAAVRAKLVAPAGVTAPGGVTVQPTAPYSLNRPATNQVAFNLGRMLTDIGRGFSRSVADTYRGTAGLSGNLGGGFSWDAYYQYGRTDREQTVDNMLILGDPANSVDNPATIANSNANFRFAVDAVVDPATGKPTCRALLSPVAAVRAAAAGCVPINLFGAGNVTAEGRNYIYGTLVEDIKLDQHVFAANVRGDVAHLWAGPLSVATGGEYRIDSIDVVHDPLSNKFAYFQNFGADFNGRTKVAEGYVEAELPLIKDQSWTRSLTINGAVREAHYDISGFGSYLRAQASNAFNATTWKVSLNWEPTHWLRVRGTRSRDVRAPNFAELFLASASSFTPIRNPFNGNASNTPSLLGGGNPDARPEIASTTTVGVVFSPDSGALQRFRFSADWYDIVVKDYLSTIPGGAQTIVDKCFAGFTEVCSLINRGAGISTGQTITEIRNITTNLDQIRSRGIDFEAAYRAPVGGQNQIQLRAIATYVQELSAVSLGDVIDRAGQTGGLAAMAAPKWIVNGTASFIAPRWSLTLQTRMIDSGLYDAQRIGPDQPRYSPTLLNSINDNHVDSRFYFNLFGSVFIDSAKRFEVFGSVNNLFDQDPPAAPETQFYTNPVYFDTLGRYYRVGARVRM